MYFENNFRIIFSPLFGPASSKSNLQQSDQWERCFRLFLLFPTHVFGFILEIHPRERSIKSLKNKSTPSGIQITPKLYVILCSRRKTEFAICFLPLWKYDTHISHCHFEMEELKNCLRFLDKVTITHLIYSTHSYQNLFKYLFP